MCPWNLLSDPGFKVTWSVPGKPSTCLCPLRTGPHVPRCLRWSLSGPVVLTSLLMHLLLFSSPLVWIIKTLAPPPPPTPTPRRCPEPSQLSPWVQTFLLFAHPTLQGQGSQHIATWFNTRASGNGLLWTTPWTRGCVPRVTGAVCPGGQTPQRGRPFRGFPTHQWCRHLGRRAHPGLGLASGKAQLARLDPTPHSPRKSTKSKASAPSSP